MRKVTNIVGGSDELDPETVYSSNEAQRCIDWALVKLSKTSVFWNQPVHRLTCFYFRLEELNLIVGELKIERDGNNKEYVALRLRLSQSV